MRPCLGSCRDAVTYLPCVIAPPVDAGLLVDMTAPLLDRFDAALHSGNSLLQGCLLRLLHEEGLLLMDPEALCATLLPVLQPLSFDKDTSVRLGIVSFLEAVTAQALTVCPIYSHPCPLATSPAPPTPPHIFPRRHLGMAPHAIFLLPSSTLTPLSFLPPPSPTIAGQGTAASDYQSFGGMVQQILSLLLPLSVDFNAAAASRSSSLVHKLLAHPSVGPEHNEHVLDFVFASMDALQPVPRIVRALALLAECAGSLVSHGSPPVLLEHLEPLLTHRQHQAGEALIRHAAALQRHWPGPGSPRELLPLFQHLVVRSALSSHTATRLACALAIPGLLCLSSARQCRSLLLPLFYRLCLDEDQWVRYQSMSELGLVFGEFHVGPRVDPPHLLQLYLAAALDETELLPTGPGPKLVLPWWLASQLDSVLVHGQSLLAGPSRGSVPALLPGPSAAHSALLSPPQQSKLSSSAPAHLLAAALGAGLSPDPAPGSGPGPGPTGATGASLGDVIVGASLGPEPRDDLVLEITHRKLRLPALAPRMAYRTLAVSFRTKLRRILAVSFPAVLAANLGHWSQLRQVFRAFLNYRVPSVRLRMVEAAPALSALLGPRAFQEDVLPALLSTLHQQAPSVLLSVVSQLSLYISHAAPPKRVRSIVSAYSRFKTMRLHWRHARALTEQLVPAACLVPAVPDVTGPLLSLSNRLAAHPVAAVSQVAILTTGLLFLRVVLGFAPPGPNLAPFLMSCFPRAWHGRGSEDAHEVLGGGGATALSNRDPAPAAAPAPGAEPEAVDAGEEFGILSQPGAFRIRMRGCSGGTLGSPSSCRGGGSRWTTARWARPLTFWARRRAGRTAARP